MVGTTQRKLTDGVCVFDASNNTGIGIKFDPDSYVAFSFSVEDDHDKFGDGGVLKSETKEVYLRTCRPGEQLSARDNQTCEVCPTGMSGGGEKVQRGVFMCVCGGVVCVWCVVWCV